MAKIKLSKKQQEWVDECGNVMGDPIGLDLYLKEGGDFYRDVVDRTCRHWEQHSTTVLHKLQNYYRFTEE